MPELLIGPLVFTDCLSLWQKQIAVRDSVATLQGLALTTALIRADANGKKLSMRELYDYLQDDFDWDNKTVHKYILNLKYDGLINLEQSDTDRRKITISMTEKLRLRWRDFDREFAKIMLRYTGTGASIASRA